MSKLRMQPSSIIMQGGDNDSTLSLMMFPGGGVTTHTDPHPV